MRATTRLAVTCLLVTVVVLGAATATPWRLSPPQLSVPELTMPEQNMPTATPTESAPPPSVPEPPTDTRWLAVIAAIFLALLVAALATYVVRQLLAIRRARTQARHDSLTGGTAADSLGEDVDLPEIQDAVTRALAHLDGHARPRDAVVAAWVALEEAAERAGTRKDPAQTPTEFAGTVLAATPAPPAAVARLRTLYQRARFTDRPIDRPAVAQAREALADIARSLDVHDVETAPGPVPGPPGPVSGPDA
jgi:hypothetical protein